MTVLNIRPIFLYKVFFRNKTALLNVVTFVRLFVEILSANISCYTDSRLWINDAPCRPTCMIELAETAFLREWENIESVWFIIKDIVAFIIVIVHFCWNIHRVQKKSNIFIFTIYFSQFLGKFYETFSEYPSVNMSTDSNLILTESVKYSSCSE